VSMEIVGLAGGKSRAHQQELFGADKFRIREPLDGAPWERAVLHVGGGNKAFHAEKDA